MELRTNSITSQVTKMIAKQPAFRGGVRLPSGETSLINKIGGLAENIPWVVKDGTTSFFFKDPKIEEAAIALLEKAKAHFDYFPGEVTTSVVAGVEPPRFQANA